MLKQIESDALAGQQDVRKTTRPRNYFARLYFFSIGSKRLNLLLRIERNKDFFRGFQSCDYHFLARDKSSSRAHIARKHSLRRDVAATEVLAQEESDARVQRPFVKPIHESASNI
jgi:hypothetical protein